MAGLYNGDLTFDVTPFVDGRCMTPIEKIQAAVDGAISPEQAVKLRQCLAHIDELQTHIETVEQEILRLSDQYSSALQLIRTVPGFDKNPMTAIWHILSELKPYTPDGFLESRPVNESKTLTTSQTFNLLKQQGNIIKDEPITAS